MSDFAISWYRKMGEYALHMYELTGENIYLDKAQEAADKLEKLEKEVPR